MKKINLCDFSDLLFVAQDLGYTWNEAHKILDNAGYYPYHGNITVYKEDVISECENEDAKKILLAFFEKNKVKEFVIAVKSS